MIGFRAFPSMSKKNYDFSIDTLTQTVRKDRLNKYFSKVGFLLQKIEAHNKISYNAKRRAFSNEVTSASQIITPHFKNLTIETPHELNQQSNYRKCNLIAFGLSQPHRPLHVKAVEELQHMFNTFGVDSFDLAIDSHVPINTSLLKHFGAITIHYNTIYINEPPRFSYISKIKYYDKALQLKDQQGIILPHPLYRLELTIKTNGKLKDMFIPVEEIREVIKKI